MLSALKVLFRPQPPRVCAGAVIALALIACNVEAQPTSNTWYTVRNKTSGLCVYAASDGTANGTQVQQWTCSTTDLGQQWMFTATSAGYYEVQAKNATSEAWDVTNVSTANGALIQLWAYGGGTNQQWQPVSEGSGYYHFVNRNSGACLDDTNGSTSNGTQLQQWSCTAGSNQSFLLATVGSATA